MHAADKPNPCVRRAWREFVSRPMKNIGLRLFVNLNPLNRKERYDAAKVAKNPQLTTAIWLVSVVLLPAHHQLGNGGQLHVGCAFVDLADFRIAPILLHRIVFGKAVAAVDFYG